MAPQHIHINIEFEILQFGSKTIFMCFENENTLQIIAYFTAAKAIFAAFYYRHIFCFMQDKA